MLVELSNKLNLLCVHGLVDVDVTLVPIGNLCIEPHTKIDVTVPVRHIVSRALLGGDRDFA